MQVPSNEVLGESGKLPCCLLGQLNDDAGHGLLLRPAQACLVKGRAHVFEIFDDTCRGRRKVLKGVAA